MGSKYYPYGDSRNSTGTLATDKLFTGQRLDDTGLYYYGARYYDPAIGRFISPDIYIQNFTNPQTINRYSYALNNPLRYTDPTGWWTFGLGINFNFTFLAWTVSGSVMIVTSGLGELGVVWSGGGGGGAGYQPSAPAGVAGGITAQAQYIPNAESIEELRGPAVQIGGSGGKGLYGGAEYVVGETYQGVNVQGGLGIGFEMHGILETAGVWESPWQMPWGGQDDASSLLPVETYSSDTSTYYGNDYYDYDWYDWYDYYDYDWYGW
jgi:RHS repeat-associated protein